MRRDNPWPDCAYGTTAPFFLALDGGGRGGREIIIEALRANDVKVMIEVGCFLCGSTLQWLRACDELTVIGVDTWDGDWASYLEWSASDPAQSVNVRHLAPEELARIVAEMRRSGTFCTAMNNVRAYRDRFVPIRRRSPDALRYLSQKGIVPELVYIDAGKERLDLEVAHELFPQAILCGDDWLWPDASGVLRMQNHVKAFAEEHDCEIRSERQSWLLIPRSSKGDPVALASAGIGG
ncbi:hypothetical protein [Reyranella sp.]|uniref:hypothetical protein n=1 Tax=Reyranella sp. TaxID=1929291 RepID=UPI003BA87157